MATIHSMERYNEARLIAIEYVLGFAPAWTPQSILEEAISLQTDAILRNLNAADQEAEL